jgi:hypothetical protein
MPAPGPLNLLELMLTRWGEELFRVGPVGVAGKEVPRASPCGSALGDFVCG